MTLSDASGSLKRFRKTPWRFQTTFVTPFKDLNRFVVTILSALKISEAGSLTIDNVIFEPKNVMAVLAKHSISVRPCHDLLLAAESRDEVGKLLVSALTDSIDFLFIPEPKPFVFYADHDEYITFYANTKSNLNRITSALSEHGFKSVPDYVRNL